MERVQHFLGAFYWLLPFIIFSIFWDSIWKLIGLWKAGRNNDLPWFICIGVFNTLGVLPIIYILLDKYKSKKTTKVS